MKTVNSRGALNFDFQIFVKNGNQNSRVCYLNLIETLDIVAKRSLSTATSQVDLYLAC